MTKHDSLTSPIAKTFAQLGHLCALLLVYITNSRLLQASWNVRAHAQKPDLVFRRNRRVHLNRRGRQFSRLLAAEVCASAVVMLDILRSEVVWKVLATHSIRQFPLHFPSRASPCAITFQMESTFSCIKIGNCVVINCGFGC